ncbi:MAG: VanZ family protein [Lachnospiraceae bacterium]|nr:VanZ family protein [Lachnospiraceae bacterium]
MRKKIFLVLAIIWMAVIFSFSAKDADSSTAESNVVGLAVGHIFVPGFDNMSEEEQLAFADKIEYPVRKTAHMTEYAVLCALFAGALYDKEHRRKTLALAFGLTVCYAVTDEIHQFFVPGRACQFTDVLIDSAGGFISTVLIVIIMTFLG